MKKLLIFLSVSVKSCFEKNSHCIFCLKTAVISYYLQVSLFSRPFKYSKILKITTIFESFANNLKNIEKLFSLENLKHL